MLAYSSVAILVVLALEGACSNTSKTDQFDAFFPHDPTQLSYVTTDDSYKLPENIVNFTLCFWLKPSAETQLSVFSYNAYPSRQYGNELGFYLESQGPKSWLCLHEKCYEFPGPKVKANAWHHFCQLYDGTNVKANLFYNGGQEKFEIYGSIGEKNYKIRGGGIVVLGQDQDTYGGGFEAFQSMRGLVNRLQMWDRVLDEDEVKQQMECDAPEGNVISWTKTPWVFRRGATNAVADTCPASQYDDDVDEEAESSECSCSGTKMADLQKTLSDAKTGILAQLAEMKEKIDKLEENNGVLTNAINLLQKNSEDILEFKGRSEILERKLDKMLQYLWKTRENGNQ